MEHFTRHSFFNGATALTETSDQASDHIRLTLKRHRSGMEPAQKRRLGIGLAVAASLSVVAACLAPSDPDIQSAHVTDTAFDDGQVMANGQVTSCSEDSPLLFEGRHNRFAITNPTTCETLLRAMPGPNETVQFDNRISIRAYTQGGVKMTMQVGDDTFVQDVPREIYRALLEGWLTTMDENQTPISIAPALYMYKQESGLGANMRVAPENGTACGMGMTTIANFAQNLMESGDKVGLGTMRWNALKIEAGMNLRARGRAVTPESETAEIGRIKETGYVNYPRLVRNSHFREIFTTRCDDVTPGAILGAQNLAIQSAYLQDQVDRGRLRLPDGRTQVTLRDAYLRYMLQGNITPLYRALHNNPNIRLDRLFAEDGVYRRNEGMFSVVENGRRRPLTAREFYNHVPERGFDDHYVMNTRGYEARSNDVGDAFRFASDTPQGTVIELARTGNPRDQFQTYARPNYDYVFVTHRGMQWRAADTQTADAAAPAVR